MYLMELAHLSPTTKKTKQQHHKINYKPKQSVFDWYMNTQSEHKALLSWRCPRGHNPPWQRHRPSGRNKSVNQLPPTHWNDTKTRTEKNMEVNCLFGIELKPTYRPKTQGLFHTKTQQPICVERRSNQECCIKQLRLVTQGLIPIYAMIYLVSSQTHN